MVNSESQSVSLKIPREELNRRRILAAARELFIKKALTMSICIRLRRLLE